MLSFFVHICKDILLTGQKIFRKYLPRKGTEKLKKGTFGEII